MAKIKKMQGGGGIRGIDPSMNKASCRRGVCGKGSVSDKRAARMDRKGARQLDKENRKEEKQYEKEQRREERYWKQNNLEKGGSIKKAQDGTNEKKYLKITTPRAGTKVTMDTTGYSAGKKRFPTKLEFQKVGLYGRTKPATVHGTSTRKSATRAIEYSQGKPYKRQTINPTGKAKKAFPKSKSGSKISKKK